MAGNWPATSFLAATFAGAFGFYLLLAAAPTWTEGLAAGGVASATTVFTVARHTLPVRRLVLGLPPGRVVVRTGMSLVTDTFRVGGALVRAISGGRSGAASWQAWRPGGRSPRDAVRRALATLLVSAAPNGFVLDLRPSALPEARHALLLHRLAPAPPSGDADWPA